MTVELTTRSGQPLPRLAPPIVDFRSRMMVLMVEVEQPEGLSSRKILIESMKHNVVTAYSGEEALFLGERAEFDLVFVHSQIDDIPCGPLIQRMRKLLPRARFISLTPNDRNCGADEFLDSFRPDQLKALFERTRVDRSKDR